MIQCEVNTSQSSFCKTSSLQNATKERKLTKTDRKSPKKQQTSKKVRKKSNTVVREVRMKQKKLLHAWAPTLPASATEAAAREERIYPTHAHNKPHSTPQNAKPVFDQILPTLPSLQPARLALPRSSLTLSCASREAPLSSSSFTTSK